jgi:two-component system, OmpR family, KDP operon response regulator KdpE
MQRVAESMSMPTRTKGNKARILVVTAEQQIQRLLKSILTDNGYQAFFAAEAAAAARAYAGANPELAILDVGSSDLSSGGKIPEIRHGSDIPVIVLGQRGEAALVAALDLGADDYVEKPLRASELLARIRSVLRRRLKAHGQEAVYRRGALVVDILDRSVARNGEPIRLTPAEFEILALLVRNSGHVVPYQRFVDSLSGAKHRRSRQALRASIWSLRRKIEETPENPTIVLTEGRVGYRLADDPSRSPSWERD